MSNAVAIADLILIVEDDEELNRLLVRTTRRRAGDLDVRGLLTADAAMPIIANNRIVEAYCDLKLPDGDGIEILEAVRGRSETARCVLLTGLTLSQSDDQRVKRARIEVLDKKNGATGSLLAGQPPSRPPHAQAEWDAQLAKVLQVQALEDQIRDSDTRIQDLERIVRQYQHTLAEIGQSLAAELAPLPESPLLRLTDGTTTVTAHDIMTDLRSNSPRALQWVHMYVKLLSYRQTSRKQS